MAEKQMVYEVREGKIVLGQFSSQAKAKSYLKECKAQDRNVRLFTVFTESDKVDKVEPKPKKVSTKPKAGPKPKADKPKKVATKPKSDRPTIAPDTSIRDWYVATYPTDDLGPSLSGISFYNLYTRMLANEPYHYLVGVPDSVIRERVFEAMSDVMHVPYKDLYELWLRSSKGSMDGSKPKIAPKRGTHPPIVQESPPKRKSPIRAKPPVFEPKPTSKPRTVKTTKPKGATKSKFSRSTRYTGRELLDLFSLMRSDYVNIHRRKWANIDSAHVCISEFDFGNDTIFGLEPHDDYLFIDIFNLKKELDPKATYTIVETDSFIVFEPNVGSPISVPIDKDDNYRVRVPDIVYPPENRFTLDHRHLKETVKRFKKMSVSPDWVQLHGEGGDLFVSANHNDFYFRADVGDGDSDIVSRYPLDHFEDVIAYLNKIDNATTVQFDTDYPIRFDSSTDYFDVMYMVAPRVDRK